MSRNLFDRIGGFDLSALYAPFSTEVVKDSTPVPFFGDYRSAKIITVSINPSSNEFPQTKRRLKHLSDIRYQPDFFQKGERLTDSMAIEKIHDGMLNYFNSGNWNEAWFEKPENALNIGFSASYFENKEMFPVKAFHTDLSPWATKQWKSLNRITRHSMINENRGFLQWLISREQYEVVLILGSGTSSEFPFRCEIQESTFADGIVPATFRSGTITLDDGTQKPYFENSYPPSVPNSKLQKGMLDCYQLFGEFIKARFEDHS